MPHNSHGDISANNMVGSPGQGEGNFEIGQILHLKFETRNLRWDSLPRRLGVEFEISSQWCPNVGNVGARKCLELMPLAMARRFIDLNQIRSNHFLSADGLRASLRVSTLR